MKVRKQDIGRFIPIRAPFIMVDDLIEAEEGHFITQFHVRPGNIFLDAGILREYALIENVAQSASAGLAWLDREKQVGPVEGFLGGISKLEVFGLPKTGDRITTRVRKLQQIGPLYMFHGQVFLQDRELMKCRVALAARDTALPETDL